MVRFLARASHEARKARANRAAADRAPIIAGLQAAAITSLTGIAAALEERGVPTSRQRGVRCRSDACSRGWRNEGDQPSAVLKPPEAHSRIGRR
jgi:hypothetical protein